MELRNRNLKGNLKPKFEKGASTSKSKRNFTIGYLKKLKNRNLKVTLKPKCKKELSNINLKRTSTSTFKSHFKLEIKKTT